jgi:hypothetical protein
VAKVGANGSLDTTTATSPVNAIMMTNAGLVGDVSLSGAKVSLTQNLSQRWPRAFCEASVSFERKGCLRVRRRRLSVEATIDPNVPLWPGKRPLAGHGLSNLRLLGHLERIVHLNPEVTHRTFKLGMA